MFSLQNLEIKWIVKVKFSIIEKWIDHSILNVRFLINFHQNIKNFRFKAHLEKNIGRIFEIFNSLNQGSFFIIYLNYRIPLFSSFWAFLIFYSNFDPFFVDNLRFSIFKMTMSLKWQKTKWLEVILNCFWHF